MLWKMWRSKRHLGRLVGLIGAYRSSGRAQPIATWSTSTINSACLAFCLMWLKDPGELETEVHPHKMKLFLPLHVGRKKPLEKCRSALTPSPLCDRRAHTSGCLLYLLKTKQSRLTECLTNFFRGHLMFWRWDSWQPQNSKVNDLSIFFTLGEPFFNYLPM